MAKQYIDFEPKGKGPFCLALRQRWDSQQGKPEMSATIGLADNQSQNVCDMG
jgi:hypothetical protein|tara:strand:+ start:297 stop:452 length:156 start_codon:yes stop_codon:yes gene_type:complete